MAKKPELHISKATFTLPEGSFNGSLDLKLNNYDVTLPQLQTQLSLRDNLAMRAYASMDERLARKNRESSFCQRR